MVPVFYVPEMVAEGVVSFAPSAGKPAQIAADWRTDVDIAPEIEFMAFDPVDRATLALAHERDYVDGVLDGHLPNGFGNRDPRVAASLPYTTGSLLAAARHVLACDADAQPRIACSPSSGFHHAHRAESSGYCTLNGLMVTALALKAAGLAERVLILDCDEHYGDGTQDIIEATGAQAWITHVTHVRRDRSGERLGGGYASRQEMMALIRRHVPRFADGGIVLYQAGADCHVDDPLGGFLTTEEMRERDRLVFTLAARHGVPLVWNLAGGYQRDARGTIAPVLALHRQTMDECIVACAELAGIRPGHPRGRLPLPRRG